LYRGSGVLYCEVARTAALLLRLHDFLTVLKLAGSGQPPRTLEQLEETKMPIGVNFSVAVRNEARHLRGGRLFLRTTMRLCNNCTCTRKMGFWKTSVRPYTIQQTASK
jgi:hypothetical protein